MDEESIPYQSSKFWGICCESGKKYSQVVSQKFHLTMAALDPLVVPTSAVVSLVVDRGGCDYLLCSLKPASILQVNLNLYFDKGEKVTFFLKGQGKIHLSGYHIYGKDEPESLEKNKLASAVSPLKSTSVSPKKVDNNQAKLNVTRKSTSISPKKEKKKALANSAKNESSDDTSSEEEEETKAVSKKITTSSKKNDKEVEMESDDEDPFEELEDSDSSSSGDLTPGICQTFAKDSKKLQNYKRLWSSLKQSSEDEDDTSEDSEEDNSMVKTKDFPTSKKLKSETPVKNNKSTPRKNVEIINLDDPVTSAKKKTPKQNDDILNSSIGRTPMPKKKTPQPNLAAESPMKQTPKKVNFIDVENEETSDSSLKNSLSETPSKEELNTSVPLSESKKKKKKKKAKNALNTSNISDDGTNRNTNTGVATLSYSKKLDQGLEYEEIRLGNGPLAKKGKLAHVYYTGRLENNKVFDSCESGSGTKPFSFKMGAGQVIKGWDIGVEGMKAGGQRRLKIPANLGYGKTRQGPIPPNSTLYFTVELKAVS